MRDVMLMNRLPFYYNIPKITLLDKDMGFWGFGVFGIWGVGTIGILIGWV